MLALLVQKELALTAFKAPCDVSWSDKERGRWGAAENNQNIPPETLTLELSSLKITQNKCLGWINCFKQFLWWKRLGGCPV